MPATWRPEQKPKPFPTPPTVQPAPTPAPTPTPTPPPTQTVDVEEVRQEFETKLTEEEAKAREAFESQLAEEEQKTREEFETQLQQVPAAEDAWMMAVGRMTEPPEDVWMRSVGQIGQPRGPSYMELYESMLETWRREERERFETTLPEWRETARQEFELSLAEWRTEQMQRFNIQLAQIFSGRGHVRRTSLGFTYTPPAPLEPVVEEPKAPPQISPSYLAYGITPTMYEKGWIKQTEPAFIKEFKQSVGEIGLTMTLMKGMETLVEHPEVVVANIMGWKGKEREEFIEFVAPFYEVFKGPKVKTIHGEEYRLSGFTTLKEFAYVPAGFIGTFERYARGDVPTPATAVLQPIFEGGRITEAQFLAEHPGYALGALLGEWFQAKYIFGPIAEKVTAPIRKVGERIYQVGYREIGWKLPEWVQKLLWPREYMERKILETFKPGLYPAHGEFPSYVIDPLTGAIQKKPLLTLAEKMAMAEKVPVYTLEKTMRLVMVDGKLVPKIFVTGMKPTGKETVWTYRAATEFIESIRGPLATRYFIPKYTGAGVFQVTRGFPTTPFAVTLSRATEKAMFQKVAMGGLSAGYKIIVKDLTKPAFMSFVSYADPFAKRVVAKGFPTLFAGVVSQILLLTALQPKPIEKTTPTVTPKPIEKIAPIITPKPKTTLFPGIKQLPEIFQIPMAPTKTTPIQVPTVTQAPISTQEVKQIQTQIQKQVQRTMQIQPSPTPLKMEVPRWLMPPSPKKRRRRKRRGEDMFDLIGRYKRFYPVLPPRKTLEKLLGI